MHLSQIARLARELNRTLILPNVEKNKIGACHKQKLSVYYDISPLSSQGDDWFVEFEEFTSWVGDHRDKRGINSQLISVAPAVPANVVFHEDAVRTNPDILAS
jgi:hypothetical protein